MFNQTVELTEADDLDTAETTSLVAAHSYTAKTGEVTVTVRPIWIEELSEVKDHVFTWVYHVIIENESDTAIQLTGRTWRIFDSTGNEIRSYNEGIGGKLPIIAPHEHFEYTSGAELKTASGFMSGFYHARLVDDEHSFDVTIPMFSLDSPYQNKLVH